VKGLEPFLRGWRLSTDGADALLKSSGRASRCDFVRLQDARAGRQATSSRNCAGASSTRHIPFLFMASRAQISRSGYGHWWMASRISSPKPFLIKDLVRITKKSVSIACTWKKLQKKKERRRAPGVIQGRPGRDEHDRPDAVAGDGTEVMPVDCCSTTGAQGELYFASGQCRDAEDREKSKATTLFTKSCLWTAGRIRDRL